MTMKTLSIVVFAVSYVLIFFAPVYGFRKAKQKHNVNLKDVKNEIPMGYSLRAACSLVYYFCIIDWLFKIDLIPWSYIPYSLTINLTGIVFSLFSVALFWWIHITLGANYHGPLKLHEHHELIMTGPYAFSRHPTYGAFLLLHLGFGMMASNFLIIISGFIMSIYVNSKRIKIEEKLLIDRFGDKYIEYSKKVGKYYIKIRRR